MTGTSIKRLGAMTVALGIGFAGQIFMAAPAQAGTLGLTVEIQGAGSVVAVEGGFYSCSSPASQNDDRVVSACQRDTFEAPFEAWVWLEATPKATPKGNWTFAGWTGCDTTRVASTGKVQCGVHSGAFSLDERRPRARFDDALAPTVSGLSAWQWPSRDRTFDFTFSTEDTTAQLMCRVDAEPYAACFSPHTRMLTEGSHTFQVFAVDPSGNAGATSSISVTAVETVITGGPSGLVNSRTATFSYTTGAGNWFDCSLDGGAWTACGTGNANTITYSNLTDGTHGFRVRAVASSSSWDATPAWRNWTVDATPPTTSLDSTSINGRNASFGFSAAASNGFQCRLSGPTSAHDWQACSTPMSYADLTDGAYTFEVRATDAAGNVDPSPPSHSWTIDLTAPETSFGSKPVDGSWVLSRAANLAVMSTETGSTFACTLDGASHACGPTSLQLTGLSSGTHVATAAATDAAGNTDATPASRRWTVPFDDRQLAATSAWTQTSARTAYLRTYSATTLQGATLTKQVTAATRLALVATKAPGHGTVKVFLGSTLLKQVSLAASTVKNKQLIPVATFTAPVTGTIKVVVSTAGKEVRVDGLGVATG